MKQRTQQTRNMRSVITLQTSLIFLLISFHAIHQAVSTTLGSIQFIEETCQKSVKSNPQLSYDFCVTSLQAEPTSHSADLQGLGTISTKLALINSTNTMKRIDKLMKRFSDDYTKERLSQCHEVYSEAIETLNKSIKAFQSGKFDDANIWLSAAYDDGSTCEEGFTEGSDNSYPLKKENDNLRKLCSIALAITHLLKT